MGIATGMKALTQNILSSSEERAEELTKIREDTNILRQEAVDMVRDFFVVFKSEKHLSMPAVKLKDYLKSKRGL